MAELVDSWEDENGVTTVLSAGGEYYAEQDGERVALELIQPAIAERHAWLTRELCCERQKAERLRADLAKAEKARCSAVGPDGAICWERPGHYDGDHTGADDEGDVRHWRADHWRLDKANRSFPGFTPPAGALWADFLRVPKTPQKPDAQLVRENDDLARGILELERDLKLTQEELKRADGALQTAHNLAEMWRQRYERALAATAEEALLPLAYFPAGEDPAARWGLTDLGSRMLSEGRAKGPAWTLLVSPDPREVLSIEVRAGSRQETLYRTAGYVSADDATAGGSFLGLLEAFVEVAKAHDEELGRAMGYLESLHLFGQDETAAEALFEALHGLRLEWKEGEAQGVVPASPSYDLAAVCARCGETYGRHLDPFPFGPALPCSGFLAAAEKVPAWRRSEAERVAQVGAAAALAEEMAQTPGDFEQEEEAAPRVGAKPGEPGWVPPGGGCPARSREEAFFCTLPGRHHWHAAHGPDGEIFAVWEEPDAAL